MTLLIELPNSRLKQYYYDVIRELHDVGLGDISTTENFYYDIQYCYQRMLNVGKCVDELIEMQGVSNDVFK